jgi:hypothetical protein
MSSFGRVRKLDLELTRPLLNVLLEKVAIFVLRCYNEIMFPWMIPLIYTFFSVAKL